MSRGWRLNLTSSILSVDIGFPEKIPITASLRVCLSWLCPNNRLEIMALITSIKLEPVLTSFSFEPEIYFKIHNSLLLILFWFALVRQLVLDSKDTLLCENILHCWLYFRFFEALPYSVLTMLNYCFKSQNPCHIRILR